MNLCFLMGKIISEVEFDFVLNSKNISVASFKLKVGKDSNVIAKTYNEMADWCYQKLVRNDVVLIQGELNSNLEIIITTIEFIESKIPLQNSKNSI